VPQEPPISLLKPTEIHRRNYLIYEKSKEISQDLNHPNSVDNRFTAA
jgi:hypothetical protein